MARTSSIAFPFSRLHREPFWKLVPLPGREITGPIIDSIASVAQLRNVALGAEVDEALFAHMASAAGRQALAGALLQSCFSAGGQAALGEQGALHGEAFRYSRVLEEAAHALPAAEKVFPGDYRAAARNQGFRRAIVLHYDHWGGIGRRSGCREILPPFGESPRQWSISCGNTANGYFRSGGKVGRVGKSFLV